jgi:hypothetical protein
MRSWLKKYWPALIPIALLIAILDGTFSSLMTCHLPVGHQANQSINAENYEQCTAFHGPALLTLKWIVNFIDDHGDVFVAAFTAVLAIFTARLWISTEKLWSVTNESIAVARDDFNATHRPWIPITKVALNFGLKWVKGTAIIGISVFCKNTGNSPASRVSLAATIFPFLPNDQIPIEIEKLKKTHSTLETRDVIERPLFPNMPDDLVLNRTLVISPEKIANLKDIYGEPATEMIPVILGAVEYYFRAMHFTPARCATH